MLPLLSPTQLVSAKKSTNCDNAWGTKWKRTRKAYLITMSHQHVRTTTKWLVSLNEETARKKRDCAITLSTSWTCARVTFMWSSPIELYLHIAATWPQDNQECKGLLQKMADPMHCHQPSNEQAYVYKCTTGKWNVNRCLVVCECEHISELLAKGRFELCQLGSYWKSSRAFNRRGCRLCCFGTKVLRNGAKNFHFGFKRFHL